MAATHSDSDVPQELRTGVFMTEEERAARNKGIEEIAAKFQELKLSEITAGKPGEEIIEEEQVGMFWLCQRPDDPLALRVSIGEGHEPLTNGEDSGYFVFRGDPGQILELLEGAISALKASHFQC